MWVHKQGTGDTALHYAVPPRQLKSLQALIELGIDHSLMNKVRIHLSAQLCRSHAILSTRLTA
jgi:hypothetical protein